MEREPVVKGTREEEKYMLKRVESTLLGQHLIDRQRVWSHIICKQLCYALIKVYRKKGDKMMSFRLKRKYRQFEFGGGGGGGGGINISRPSDASGLRFSWWPVVCSAPRHCLRRTSVKFKKKMLIFYSWDCTKTTSTIFSHLKVLIFVESSCAVSVKIACM